MDKRLEQDLRHQIKLEAESAQRYRRLYEESVQLRAEATEDFNKRTEAIKAGAMETISGLESQLATAHASADEYLNKLHDAGARIGELQEKLAQVEADHDAWKAKAEAAEAKLDTLTNALTSMVLGADSDTPIGEIQDRIKVWLEDKEALQAENARLVALLEDVLHKLPHSRENIDFKTFKQYNDMTIALIRNTLSDTTPHATESARQPIQSWNFEVGIRDVLEAYDGRQLAGDEGLSIVESKYNVNQMRDDIEYFTASYYDKWHYARSAGYLTTDKRPQLTQDGLDLLRSMQERDELSATKSARYVVEAFMFDQFSGEPIRSVIRDTIGNGYLVNTKTTELTNAKVLAANDYTPTQAQRRADELNAN